MDLVALSTCLIVWGRGGLHPGAPGVESRSWAWESARWSGIHVQGPVQEGVGRIQADKGPWTPGHPGRHTALCRLGLRPNTVHAPQRKTRPLHPIRDGYRNKQSSPESRPHTGSRGPSARSQICAHNHGPGPRRHGHRSTHTP